MANVLVGHRVVQTRQIQVGHAETFEVKEGQLVQIIDMAGAQVASLCAWSGDERLSPTTTTTANASIVLKKGDTLFGSDKTPFFELVDDSVGRHDLLTGPMPAPEPTSKVQTVVPSNYDGIKATAREADIAGKDVSAPVNFFKHVVIKSKGELEVKESFSERNDTVVLRALVDVTVLVSNAYHERRPGVTAGKQAAEKTGELLVRVYA